METQEEHGQFMLQQNKTVEVNGHQQEQHHKRRRHHRDHDSTFFEKMKYAWSHATVGPVFFFFLTAYMMQTSLVTSHIKDRLRHDYNVTYCKLHSKNESKIHEIAPKHEARDAAASVQENIHEIDRDAINDSAVHRSIREPDAHADGHTGAHDDPCHLNLEMFEEQLGRWNLILFFVYAGPALIMAPIVGSWTDGLHRVVPMYLCVLGLIASSLASGLAMLLRAPILDLVFCVLPSGLTGGAVIFSLAMYSYEAEKNDNFDIFESYLTLQCLQMAAGTCVQVLIYLCSASRAAKQTLLWGPLVFSLISAFGLLHRRIKDHRRLHIGKCSFCRFVVFRFPKDFVRLVKFRLWAMHISLFICAFVFFYAYVGETAEIMNILTAGESWQIASFSVYGAAQDAVESVGLLVTLYFWKNVIHKKIIDKELLPHFSVFLLGILGHASDMLTKIVICVTPTSTVQYWEPLIGVIAELSIVVVRYFSVLLVDKKDVGKVLSLVTVAQITATIPAAISANEIRSATFDWWPNFIYLFLALIQLIPIGLIIFIMKSANLPAIDLHPEKNEQEENTESELKTDDNA